MLMAQTWIGSRRSWVEARWERLHALTSCICSASDEIRTAPRQYQSANHGRSDGTAQRRRLNRTQEGRLAPVPDRAVTIYDDRELTKFFAACDENDKLLFNIYLLTGFRMREVSTLTWNHIEWKRGTLKVQPRPAYRFNPKSHESREVPVPRV
jgi:integrase